MAKKKATKKKAMNGTGPVVKEDETEAALKKSVFPYEIDIPVKFTLKMAHDVSGGFMAMGFGDTHVSCSVKHKGKSVEVGCMFASLGGGLRFSDRKKDVDYGAFLGDIWKTFRAKLDELGVKDMKTLAQLAKE